MLRRFLALFLGLGVLAPALAFAASDSTMMEHSSMSEGGMMMQSNEGMMSGDHMGMMMTHGLNASCSSLKNLSSDEKAKMLTDIGHSMDAGALRQVLRCMFSGAMKKRVMRIIDADLKFDPKHAETLYYVPSTHQFFVTCTGMKTVAYVVQGDENITNPRSYFTGHHQQFADAAKMGKAVFEKMMMEVK